MSNTSYNSNSSAIGSSSFKIHKQIENYQNINKFEHIRVMQINKIRINNARDWDVAKFDQFIQKGADRFNIPELGIFASVKGRLSSKKTPQPQLQDSEQIINEEVRISDFAYSIF